MVAISNVFKMRVNVKAIFCKFSEETKKNLEDLDFARLLDDFLQSELR